MMLQTFSRQRHETMRLLHTMLRVGNLQRSINFYTEILGMTLIRTSENLQHQYSLAFVGCGTDPEHAQIELTHNWDQSGYDGGRNFGHLAYLVDDIYEACDKLRAGGVTINRPPRDGRMAFVRSPDGISIELLQKGPALVPAEPWASMPNTGNW